MASFLTLYNDIEDKLRKTSSQLVELQGRIQKLQEENETLRKQAAVMAKMQTEPTENINTQHNTQIYNTNTKNDDTIYKIKEEISEIVREIDNCIGILNAE